MDITTTLHRRRRALRLATAFLLAVSLPTHAMSPLPHAVIGLLFALAAAAHVGANARWIRGVTRRMARGLPRRTAVDAALAVALVALAVAVTVTGIAALVDVAGGTLPAARGGGDAGPPGVAGAHGPLAVLLALTGVVHAVRHRDRHRRVPRPAPPRSAGLSGHRQTVG